MLVYTVFSYFLPTRLFFNSVFYTNVMKDIVKFIIQIVLEIQVKLIKNNLYFSFFSLMLRLMLTVNAMEFKKIEIL